MGERLTKEKFLLLLIYPFKNLNSSCPISNTTSTTSDTNQFSDSVKTFLQNFIFRPDPIFRFEINLLSRNQISQFFGSFCFCSNLIKIFSTPAFNESWCQRRDGTSPNFLSSSGLELWVSSPDKLKPAKVSLMRASSPSFVIIKTRSSELKHPLSFLEN